MKIDLKTLKDIEYGHVETDWISGECTAGFTGVNKEELKKWAIKLVKYYGMNHRQGNLPCEALIIFLNITDEELGVMHPLE